MPQALVEREVQVVAFRGDGGARHRPKGARAAGADECRRPYGDRGSTVTPSKRFHGCVSARMGTKGLRGFARKYTDCRTGVFTSGIVSTREDHHVALFFTGVQHAGENLADVLVKRAAELPTPIQMCDALAANTAGEFDSIVAGCTSHARRRFVDVAEDFPSECRYVLETLRDVYRNDADARQ